MVVCYLGVGSNLGDKSKNIKSAIKKISRLKNTKVLKTSKLICSAPQGGPKGQPDYLNSVLKIKTSLSAQVLLRALKKIEYSLGRPRAYPKNSPRIIDLDILLYSDKKINNKNLVIPHPRMFKRDFVLKPLMEVL